MVPEKLTFSPLVHRKIEADFSGGHITSDAGLLLLREVDKQHQLTRRLASVLQDSRTPEMIRHKLDTMVRQRVFGVAAGNDTFTEFDPAEYLVSKEAMAAFINDALETGDSAYIAKALGVIARAKGMADLAQQTGLSRESLYRSFSSKGNPTLKTVLAVTKALGIDITAKPHAA